jgi:DNA-binding response OmpR family regulator
VPNGYRLLVVEDDAALCESIADVLRFTGYDVATARDGESALKVLHGPDRLDAVLLDVVLPRKTAAEVLEDLEASGEEQPSVVLMTGMIGGARPRTSRDVLLKPFGVDELLARVERACRGHLSP